MEEAQSAQPSMARALEAPEDERAEALLAVVREAQVARWSDTWVWQRDRAFVRGETDGAFSAGSRHGPSRWTPNTRVRDSVRQWMRSFNHIGKISAQVRAINTQERPAFDAVAGSNESEDRETARASKTVLKWVWRRHTLEDVYADATQGAFDVGTKILQVDWDHRAGGRSMVKTPGAYTPETYDAEGQMISPPNIVDEESEEPDGDLRWRLREPEEVILPSSATYRHTPEWMVVEDFFTLAEIEDRYGEELAEQSETGTSEDEFRRRSRPGIGRASIHGEEELVRHLTVYYKRSRRFPRGKKVCFGHGVIYEEGDNPVYPAEDEPQGWWPGYHFPLFAFRWFLDDDSWYGRSGTSDLVPFQQDINGYAAKMRMIAAKHSGSRRKAPKGTNFIESDDPSAIIFYNRMHGDADQIKWEVPPQFPQELFMLLRDAIAQMEDVSGINAAIQGRASSEDSGVKVREQRERATGRLAPIKASHDRVMAMALLHALTLIRRNLPENSLMLVVGENNRTSVEVFRKADLSSMVDVYPVNNPLSSDPTQRMLQMGQLAQMLAQTPDPVTQSRMVAALGMEELMQLEHFLDIHRQRALRENQKMMRGEPAAAHQFDEDMTHLSIHTAEYLSEAAQSKGEEYQTALLDHCQQHLAQLGVKQQAEMGGGAQPPQGGAGGPPAAPQPQDRPSAATPQQAIA